MSSATATTTATVTEKATDRVVLSEDARRLLFTEARTNQWYLPTPVPDSKLKEMYELWKFGPTAANTLPARVLFVKSAEAREKLIPTLMDTNKEKVATAPVTAIIAYDATFFEHIPRLVPPLAFYKDYLAANAEAAKAMAVQSSALQAAYFILAARAVGLDAGPMGGFDQAAVDKAFFEGTDSRKTWKSQVIINLGYADSTKLYPRLPRFDFEEVSVVV